MDVIEQWAKAEYSEGVSAGAAARQLCSLLGSNGCAPSLKAMLESMLSGANRASFDRSCILRAFDEAAPEAAAKARAESFRRLNPNRAAASAEQAPAQAPPPRSRPEQSEEQPA